MSDFVKLNGYNVKDSTARDSIDTINSNITEINQKINNIKSNSSSISIQNYIVYDGIGTDYSQGSCMAPDGTIYVYESDTSYNGGNILVFSSEALSTSISTNMYHANSLCYLNGKIYAATVNGTMIVSYEVGTGTRIEFNPFTALTGYKISSASVYDDNHLLCVLHNSNEAIIGSTEPTYIYLLDIRDNSYIELTKTNSKNLNLDFYAYQGACYQNGHLYILTSFPDLILDYKIDGTTADLDRFYTIPERDALGLLIGEVEDISPTPAVGVFLLTSNVEDNSARTIMTHFIGINTELSPMHYQDVDVNLDKELDDTSVYVDNNASLYTLYEDGSILHPFRTARRGIASSYYGTYYVRKNVQIEGRGSSYPYTIGSVDKVNNISIYNWSRESLALYIDGTTTFNDSIITFNQWVNDQIVINNLTLNNTIFKSVANRLVVNGLIELNKNSDASFFSITQGNTGTSTPLTVNQGCRCQIWFSGATASTATYLAYIRGDALLISNIETTKVNFDNGVYLKVGNSLD